MDTSAIIPSFVISQADIKTAKIRSGEMLRVYIRDAGQDGTVKFLLKGIPIEAKTDVPLETGSVINVKALVTDSKIILRLIPSDETSKTLEMIKKLLPEKAELGKLLNEFKANDLKPLNVSKSPAALKTLRQFLDRILIDSSAADEESVKTFIEKGGQFYEASLKKTASTGSPKTDDIVKLAGDDLKPLIMNLIEELAKDGRYKGLLKTLDSVLKNIELNQLINSNRAKADALYFQIPVYFGENLETLELYFFEEKGQKDKSKREGGYGIVLSINLSINLTELGDITFDARVRLNTVFINIYTEDKEASLFLSSHLDILKKAIESRGLNIGGIECTVGKKETAKKLWGQISNLSQQKTGLIDEFA